MAFNFFGISIPQISLPKISLPSLPKFSLPSFPKIPQISLPKFSLPSLPQISLPAGMRAGTKAAQRFIEEQAQRARWAAEAAAEAAGGAAANLPKVSLPTLPKVDLPKVTLPDISKVPLPKVDLSQAAKVISLPAVAGGAVAGAVGGNLPKIDLPKISLPDVSKVSLLDLSNVPGLGLVSGAGAAAMSAVQRGELPKITLPALPGSGSGSDRIITQEEAARSGIPTGGVTTPAGGNIIDTIIGARDRSYEVGIEHIAAGNIAGGGAQFGATAAADVLLPLDLLDVSNKWMTGRGNEIDGETALWAAIDAVSLAAAPFTFGASYAAARAAKAGKVAAKTAKIGGEMGKISTIRRIVGAVSEAGKKATPASYLKQYKKAAPITSTSYLKGYQQQAKAAQQSYAKQFAKFQDDVRQQQAKLASQMREQQAKLSEQISKSLSGLKPAGETSKAATVMGKTGNTLKAAGLGLGVGAIGLTALGALGGPAPEEAYPPGSGGGLPGLDGTVLPSGGEEPWWTFPELPGFEDIPEFPEIPGYDPEDPGYYPPEEEYYPPAYPDPFGLEYPAQDFIGYGEGLPGIGPLLTAAKENGLALPALVGAGVLVAGGVVLLRSKRGKQMIGGVKKQVSGAISAGKKAVGA